MKKLVDLNLASPYLGKIQNGVKCRSPSFCYNLISILPIANHHFFSTLIPIASMEIEDIPTPPKPHAIIIAFGLQGHVIPAVHLAIKLASKGLTITFVNTEVIHHEITKSKRMKSDQMITKTTSLPEHETPALTSATER